MKRYNVFILLTLISGNVLASNHDCRIYDRQMENLSPCQTRFNNFEGDIRTRENEILSQHPVYEAMTEERLADTTRKDTVGHGISPLLHNQRNIIATSYGAGKQTGDFLTYEGRSNYDWRIYGHGSHRFGKDGTLYGTVQYARGKHRGISWNAMRYPELYWPYAITDSTGGDSQFESYKVEGGYGVNLGKMWLGAIAQFDGEQAHRMTDPRVLNNTTFLQLGMDLGYLSANKHRWMLECKYLRNKQYEHDRYWRPGEQQRFFVLYGFGLYDTKESSVSFGRSRMFYINGLKSHLSYSSPEDEPLQLNVNLGYQYNHLNVEESDIMDLYAKKTTILTPQLHLQWQCGNRTRLHLYTEHNLQNNLGYERVFEKYMTNVATSTYDYRQIAEYQNYKLSEQTGNGALRAEFDLGKHSTMGVQGGITYFNRTEQNTFYDFKVENFNLTPYGRLDYRLAKKRYEFALGLQMGHQQAIRHKYDVEITASSIEHLDFQTCFAPYAYFAAEYWQTCADLSYTYFFKGFGLGAKMCYMNITGDRLSDVIYTKTIGFNSVCPMISTNPDQHNEQWFNTSLFVVF